MLCCIVSVFKFPHSDDSRCTHCRAQALLSHLTVNRSEWECSERTSLHATGFGVSSTDFTKQSGCKYVTDVLHLLGPSLAHPERTQHSSNQALRCMSERPPVERPFLSTQTNSLLVPHTTPGARESYSTSCSIQHDSTTLTPCVSPSHTNNTDTTFRHASRRPRHHRRLPKLDIRPPRPAPCRLPETAARHHRGFWTRQYQQQRAHQHQFCRPEVLPLPAVRAERDAAPLSSHSIQQSRRGARHRAAGRRRAQQGQAYRGAEGHHDHMVGVRNAPAQGLVGRGR